MPRNLVLAGDVAYLTIDLTVLPPEEEENVFRFLQEEGSLLFSQIESAARRILGPQFEVRRFEYRRGTIKIWVVLFAAYVAISRYKSFIESLELFASQVRDLVRRFLGNRASVDVNWFLGPALAASKAGAEIPETFPLLTAAIAYLILSHAALVTLVIWLIARRPQ